MARVVVREWWDVFEFTDADTALTCPDCDEQSPGLPDVFTAVQWVDRHYQECNGGRPSD